MLVTLELPDDIAEALASQSSDLSRRALEALAIDGYRDRKLTQLQVGRLLCLSRIETEDFLARHIDLYDYDPSELHREADALKKYAERPAH
jgi:predicted HTH domain antitoxin